MNEVRVTSWNELHERLYESSWMPSIARFRSHYAFRGVSDADHTLITSLNRMSRECGQMEGHMLRNFMKYARRYTALPDTFWYWLSVAQHHGLPTRLMDWTFSPYVAMHFATAIPEYFDRDGAIWCVDYTQTHALLPEVLKTKLEAEGSDVFTVEMLSEVTQSLKEFDALAEEDFVVFFEPPSIDDRIVNQYALFCVMSNPEALMDVWLESHPELCRKIVIPQEIKWEVRDKLDQANITERVLFPGLDGLSLWLKRHYSTRN